MTGQKDGSFCEGAAQLQEALYALMVDVNKAVAADDPLAGLLLLHDASGNMRSVRALFADLKGVAAAQANDAGASYPAIARRLSCSEPYVQQMVYRGRARRAV